MCEISNLPKKILKEKPMKQIKFKKVLTLLTLLLMLGQIFIPTAQVLAETLPSVEQSNQTDNSTEQTTQTEETKEVSQDTVEEATTLPIPTETSETNQSNAPPVATEDLLSTDLTEPIETEEVGSLQTDADGNIYYNGEALFYEDGKVPANMEELFKAGVPVTFTTRSARANTATIEYRGTVTWSYHTVGDFRVNGRQAFCLQHPKGTPASGTPNYGTSPLNNKKIAAIMYWGWNGTKNIFSDYSAGMVATSLALSHFYYGDSYGSMPSGYDTLIAKANTEDVPDHRIKLNSTNSLVNLPVTYNASTGIQKSATATVNADSQNSITFSIPSGITFVNETTGAKATSGNVTVKGGQKYHFEAGATTQATISHQKLKGILKEFQPLVVKPVSSGLQDLGTWQWYDDPAQTVSFKADFVKRNGNVQLAKVDADTGVSLAGAKFKYVIDGVEKEGTTNANGLLNINDILDGKKVTITEMVAPTGYVLNSTPQTVTVKAGETIKVKFTNKKIMGSVKLLKYADEDWQTGAKNTFLENAEFTLFKADGTTKVQTQTTNAKGELTFSNVEYGFGYIIRETSTPEGYTPVADMTVDITTDGQVIQLTATDKVIREDMKLIKIDDGSNLAILSKDAQFEITNLQTNLKLTQKDALGKETTIFTTNDKGEILLPNLPYGRYRIKEVNAPFGYLQLSKPVDFFINGKNNGILTVKIGNKVVKGQVEMTKTGEKVTTVETQETDYGTLYHTVISQEPLKDVTFDIFAREDIVSGDGKVQHKAGDLVGTYTTDEAGKFMSNELFIGSYFAKEKTAPNGFIIKEDEIDFTIDYEGQLVPLTSSSIEAENNWNKAKVIVNKLDETLVSYEDNQLVTEDIASNGKVFGLFRSEAYSFNEEELIPTDGLVGVATTVDGQAIFEGQFPDGNYYVQELNAGDSHVISDTKYPVSLTPTDNREELTSNVYADKTFLNNENFNRMARNPIINKLFKTSIPFEKINETSKLQEGTGYIYEYNQLGEGAEFELKNADGEVIQTAIIDKDGLGVWNDLVVGSYTFNETKTSNDTLVLDETVYSIEVTQEKTVITDTTDGTVLAEVDNTVEAEKDNADTENEADVTKEEETTETDVDVVAGLNTESIDNDLIMVDDSEEPTTEEILTPVITLKNRAIRGNSELTKTDVSNGKELPNTGIEIKDENGKTVVKGRTDSNGKFVFDNLPKGKYTFTEFDAPKGYIIDSTPIPFEIKEDGDIIKCQMTNVKEADKLRQTKEMKNLMAGLSLTMTSLIGFALVLRSKRDDEILY